ncbi:MAG: DUF5615 family PIN-like protein [Bacteroidetes bacterium]|nr:DUF5615 family PIN-like protein [Bacteroidota bacterium]
MRLLFDENLSFKICKKIADVLPDARHVSDIRLNGVSDIEIWRYAKDNDFCIVTFDSDFIDISVLHGFPPKIIWLKTGNTTVESIAQKLKSQAKSIIDFQKHY